jgi:hypothetical protein
MERRGVDQIGLRDFPAILRERATRRAPRIVSARPGSRR